MNKPSEAAVKAAQRALIETPSESYLARIVDAAADEKYKPLVEAVDGLFLELSASPNAAVEIPFLLAYALSVLRQALKRVKGVNHESPK